MVVRAEGSDDSTFGDPARATNGARGGGCCSGSTDVYSLDPAAGRDELVLAFQEPIVDGPGDDLAVFENPFDIAGSEGRFMDPLLVTVSADGDVFAEFPHTYDAPDPTVWSSDPEHWNGFAGITPVFLHEDDNPVDPSNREEAGGDGFDLADLAPGAAADAIREHGVLYVRLVPAFLATDPATGSFYPADPVSDGPDVDAVYGWSVTR